MAVKLYCPLVFADLTVDLFSHDFIPYLVSWFPNVSAHFFSSNKEALTMTIPLHFLACLDRCSDCLTGDESGYLCAPFYNRTDAKHKRERERETITNVYLRFGYCRLFNRYGLSRTTVVYDGTLSTPVSMSVVWCANRDSNPGSPGVIPVEFSCR